MSIKEMKKKPQFASFCVIKIKSRENCDCYRQDPNYLLFFLIQKVKVPPVT